MGLETVYDAILPMGTQRKHNPTAKATNTSPSPKQRSRLDVLELELLPEVVGVPRPYREHAGERERMAAVRVLCSGVTAPVTSAGVIGN